MSNEKIGRVFNNADSFAMAFDSAWEEYCTNRETNQLSTKDKIELILSKVSDHPFFIDHPSRAVEIANFRLKLLNLE